MESNQTRPSQTGHDDAPVVSYVQQLLEQALSALHASGLPNTDALRALANMVVNRAH